MEYAHIFKEKSPTITITRTTTTKKIIMKFEFSPTYFQIWVRLIIFCECEIIEKQQQNMAKILVLIILVTFSLKSTFGGLFTIGMCQSAFEMISNSKWKISRTKRSDFLWIANGIVIFIWNKCTQMWKSKQKKVKRWKKWWNRLKSERSVAQISWEVFFSHSENMWKY